MPSPAAAAAAAAAGGRHRLAAFAGDSDDSDEETVEEAFDDGEEVDDHGKHEQQKPLAAPPEGSNEDSSLSTSSANTNNSSGNPAAAPTPIPNLNGAAGAVAVRAMDDGYATPQRKRQRREATGTARSTAAAAAASASLSMEARRPLAALEESRRLFQRLWTDEDEIAILQGFLDFTSRQGKAAPHHHQHDTGPFYDQIRARLQLDFNKSQLVEKLRRLKKKYRNVTTRMSSGKDFAFKTPHDQVTFELSRQIWGNATVYSRGGGGDDDDVDLLTPRQIGDVPDRCRRRRRGRKRSVAEVAATAAAEEALVVAAEAPVEVKVAESHMPKATAPVPVPNVIEETVRSCLSPMFKDLLCCAGGGRSGAGAGGLDGLRLSLLPLGVGSHQVNLLQSATVADEKWRQQQILELEVFSKRMELLQEQIKLMLRELRSAG